MSGGDKYVASEGMFWFQRVLMTMIVPLIFAMLVYHLWFTIKWQRDEHSKRRSFAGATFKFTEFITGKSDPHLYRKASHFLTIATLFVYLVNVINYFVDIWSVYDNPNCTAIKIISFETYQGGKALLYCVLAIRLKIAFGDSSVAKQKYVVWGSRVLVTLLICYFCLFLPLDMTVVSGSHDVLSKNYHSCVAEFPFWGIALFNVLDMSISILCLVLFYKPLADLTKMMHKQNIRPEPSHDMSSNNADTLEPTGSDVRVSVDGDETTDKSADAAIGAGGNSSNNLSLTPKNVTKKMFKSLSSKNIKKSDSKKNVQVKKDSRMAKLLTKYVILATTAIISTFCFTLMYGVMSIGILIMVDEVINGICLIFLSAWYDRYYKILFHPCVLCSRCISGEFTQKESDQSGLESAIDMGNEPNKDGIISKSPTPNYQSTLSPNDATTTTQDNNAGGPPSLDRVTSDSIGADATLKESGNITPRAQDV